MRRLKKFILKALNGEKILGAKLSYPNGLKAVIFASGRGSNAEALMEFSEKNDLFEVVALASDQVQAPVLAKAKKRGIPTIVYPRKKGQPKKKYEQEWLKKLEAFPHDLGLLCGYMKILGPNFLQAYFSAEQSIYRLINIHPSKLPDYPGLNSYRRAFDNNEAVAGVTLHLVDERVDTGPILWQETFKRFEKDSFEDFERRGLELEHRLFSELIQKIITEGLEIQK